MFYYFLKSTFKKLLYTYYLIKGKKYILILSHTRSGSTLLTQILTTSEQIKGNGELFIPYFEKGNWALTNIPLTLNRKKIQGIDTCKYFLDKVLFNELITAEELLKSSELKTIFLFRKPESSLPSIYKKEKENNIDFTQDAATEYYISRTNTLLRYLSIISPNNKIIIHYEDLVKNTETTLENISTFLNLKIKLSSNYNPYEISSGYIGDHSPYIFEGKILNNIKSTASDIVFDYSLMDKATKHYQMVMKELKKYQNQ